MPNSARKISLTRLCELWDKYTEFQKGQLAPTTVRYDYQKIARRLERMKREAPYLDSAVEIRDWLLSQYSPETARRTMQQINACGRWALSSDIITVNPFEGLQRHIKPKRKLDLNWAAFTTEERDRIIQEFEVRERRFAPWVKFLFWTGCRPEEARALRWENISGDCLEILFREAFPMTAEKPQHTKNYQVTRFPCNSRLQRLLRELREFESASSEGWVFLGEQLGPFNYHNFQTRAWKPLVNDLRDRGLVAFYLTQYNCRHTWITEALNHLSPQDVSYLARVSVQVLYKHYAGRSRRITIPEF